MEERNPSEPGALTRARFDALLARAAEAEEQGVAFVVWVAALAVLAVLSGGLLVSVWWTRQTERS